MPLFVEATEDLRALVSKAGGKQLPAEYVDFARSIVVGKTYKVELGPDDDAKKTKNILRAALRAHGPERVRVLDLPGGNGWVVYKPEPRLVSANGSDGEKRRPGRPRKSDAVPTE